MHTLIDFLNHGILPFAGRSREIESLLSFWRGTSEARELRAALLLGEAGIGKSRLLAETLPEIVRSGGAVVHARLYPASTLSVVPVIAGALWSSEAGRRLLREEPAPDPGSVAAALRRLSRLRPTLLVIEDIHLLRGDALKELGVLLGSVADETLSLLCVARPVELEARPLLERYLTEEIRLEGLHRGELLGLIATMFEIAPGDDLVEPLLDRTLGNPLALRSALRGALKSGALVDGVGGWGLTVPRERFSDMLGQSVGLLSEGLAADLVADEREAAGGLATLGEVFSREAARAMIDDADKMIERLVFKGIIVPSPLASEPLPGAHSGQPLLVFTHTLVHRFCVEHATPDTDRLIRVASRELPVYSILPFELLHGASDTGAHTVEEIDGAIRRALMIALKLDYTASWEQAPIFLRTAEHLIETFRSRFDPATHHRIELALLHNRLSLGRRRYDGEEFREGVMRMLAMTNDPPTEEVARYRLASLCRLRGVIQRYDHARSRESWREAEELVERFPTLLTSLPYIYFLQDVVNAASSVADRELLDHVEERLASILERHEVSDEYRHHALTRVWPFFLLLFGTPEELRRRRRMLAEGEAVADGRDLTFLLLKSAFLARTGDADEVLRISERSLPLYLERGMLRNFYTGKVYQLCARAAFGAPLEELEREARELAATAPPVLLPAFRSFVGESFVDVGLLRGDDAWAGRMMREFLGGEDDLRGMQAVMLVLGGESGSLGGVVADENEPDVGSLLGLALGRAGADPDAARREAEGVLRGPTLRLAEMVAVGGVVALVEECGRGSVEFAASLRETIMARVGEMLGWLEERELFAYMGPMIARYGGYLSEGEAEGWRERAAAIERRRAPSEPSSDERIVVSMLGAITIRRPGGEAERLRGGRSCALLGLLVADGMLEKPLAHREFCIIATGNEEEPERARKSLNKAVQRLREAIGHDAIVTDGETPRLNPALVQVDLLDLHRLVAEASSEARAGLLMRAVPPLRRALDLARDVPFPSLYEDFFEAARGDFELRLRTAVIEVAGALQREGDPGGAEELLAAATGLMPGDDELAGMLRRSLVALGRNTDAERIRLQSSAT
jgi:DNA-binding SARP family transcriptional activator